MNSHARVTLLLALAAGACSGELATAPDQAMTASLSKDGDSKEGDVKSKDREAAIRLDGVDGSADVVSAAVFNVSTVTVEAWVRLHGDVGPTQAPIVNRQASQTGSEAWGLEIFGAGYPGTISTGNEVVFHSNNCVATKNLQAGFNLRKHHWYHLAAVNDGTMLRVYVDGVLVGSSPSLGPACALVDAPIVIGKTGPSPTFFFDGEIDEIRIWSVARAAWQIAANMDSGLSGDEPGLLGYWTFDEGAGTTAVDATGRGHDATLRNGASWKKHKVP